MKFVIIRVVNRLLHSNHEKPMLEVLNQTYYISSKRMLYKLAVSVNSYWLDSTDTITTYNEKYSTNVTKVHLSHLLFLLILFVLNYYHLW